MAKITIEFDPKDDKDLAYFENSSTGCHRKPKA